MTSTVAIPPLIAASILSKKIAEGTNALVMDVKVGSGGFLEDEQVARKLSEMLVRWSQAEGVRTVVFGTDMERPLGRAAGNAPEVLECLNILQTGEGDVRLLELSRILGGAMLMLGEKAKSLEEGTALFDSTLKSGAGFRKLQEVAETQGSSAATLANYRDSWRPSHKYEFRAKASGFIIRVNPREVGLALVDLGAGRRKSDDPVDHSAGVVFAKQEGDEITAGDLWATAYWTNALDSAEGMRRLEGAITIGDVSPLSRPLLQFYCDESGCRSLDNARPHTR